MVTMPLTVLQVYLSWDARPHQVCALLQHHGRVKRAVPTPTLSPLPSGTYPHTVRGLTSSPTLGLHALGTSGGRGVAWSWTGTAWVVQSLLPMPINAVDVSGNELVAAGDSGHIYRRVR